MAGRVKARKVPVGKPAYKDAQRGSCREWTEITLDPGELMTLLDMPKDTRLISIGSSAMTGVKITVEEPMEA